MRERGNGYEIRHESAANSELDTIPTLIISEHTLLREGMKSFLAGSRYDICYEVSEITDALTLGGAGDTPRLIIIGSSLNSQVLEPLRSLRAAFPESRIVFYAQAEGMAAHDLIATFQAGHDGRAHFSVCTAEGQHLAAARDLGNRAAATRERHFGARAPGPAFSARWPLEQVDCQGTENFRGDRQSARQDAS